MQYYRLSEDIKDDFIKFFNELFSQYGEGKISFNNSKRKIVFAEPPKCQSLDSYDFKYFPLIAVGTSSGNFRETSFNKLRGYVTDHDTGLPVEVTGGIFSINLNFNIYAQNKDDRNNLADLVGDYLSKRDTKLAFLQSPFAYRLGMPSFSGDGAEDDPQTNSKYFYTTISMPIETDFEDIADVVDQFGHVGLTVEDIVSLIASKSGSGEVTGF
jgi:hypothetical protein